MKSRRPVLLALAIAAVLAAGVVARPAGASKPSAAAGKTISLLRVGITNPGVGTLDLSRSNNAVAVASLGLEQLMQISPSGKLVPWLAQSVTHPNATTYIYHLRQGVKFWDGNEMTSTDVANALNYERYPGALGAPQFRSVKHITATGRFTVVVTLLHPDASWQYVPAEFYTEIFEKKFQDAHKTTMGQPGTLIMGTGPYKFDSFDPTSGAELSANPHYWGGKVPIQHISVKFYANETSEALAFRSGELDVAPDVSDAQGFASTAGSSAKIVGGQSCAEAFFSMDTQVAPWNDIHVRRAVAYVVNRQDLIKAWGGYATPNYTLIPPIQLDLLGSQAQVNALIKSLPSYPFSIAKAKQEMAQSAYPHGFSTTLDALQNQVNTDEAVAAELKQIGINASVNIVGIGPFIADLGPNPAMRKSVFDWSGCISPDPSYYSYVLGSQNAQAGYNSASYAPAAVNNLLTAAITAKTSAQRLATYGQVLKQLAVDVPYVPLFTTDYILAISPKFSWPTYVGVFYNRSWGLKIKPS